METIIFRDGETIGEYIASPDSTIVLIWQCFGPMNLRALATWAEQSHRHRRLVITPQICANVLLDRLNISVNMDGGVQKPITGMRLERLKHSVGASNAGQGER